MVNVAMNRAVHLARRDAHYRCFVRLLKNTSKLTSLARRRARIRKILYHIGEAYHEANYALRGAKKRRGEKQFVRYLDLMFDAAKAAEVMVEHERLIKEDKSFLNQFLGTGPEFVRHFEERHRQMLGDSLGGMSDIVARADQPYRKLMKNYISLAGADDLRRYKSAFEAVAGTGKDMPRVAYRLSAAWRPV